MAFHPPLQNDCASVRIRNRGAMYFFDNDRLEIAHVYHERLALGNYPA